LANEEARQRMDQHNFCRGLAEVVKELDGEVIRDGLFEKGVNPLNPSAIYVIVKNGGSGNCEPRYACPVYKTPISVFGDCFYSPDSMRAYPILGGIPVLRSSQGIIASRFEDFSQGGGN
ncbi:MAG: hypothetical protein P1V20_15880, partial [Verrucomicrobiales bacterium]|nr:hypothetical protein [Verrucomicrobiales bacterium]